MREISQTTTKRWPTTMRMPTSSSKSHLPNWLEKLRKVKGFPSVNDSHSLDHFLSQQQQQQQQEPNDPATDDDDLHPSKRRPSMPEKEDVSNRMSNMLSDLFSDGRSSSARSSNFKAPRKQPSPRICILRAAAAAAEDNGSSDSDKDVNRNLESKGKVRRGLKEEEGEGEERRRKLGESDLVGFSRTEVTVIDSSNPLWKFDKYLFRKKNVWKARDCRRGGPYNENNNNVAIGRKKKMKGLVDDDDDDDGIVVRKKRSFGARK